MCVSRPTIEVFGAGERAGRLRQIGEFKQKVTTRLSRNHDSNFRAGTAMSSRNCAKWNVSRAKVAR
jgi:hypothetical protein